LKLFLEYSHIHSINSSMDNAPKKTVPLYCGTVKPNPLMTKK
jgi:hypothetical protein